MEEVSPWASFLFSYWTIALWWVAGMALNHRVLANSIFLILLVAAILVPLKEYLLYEYALKKHAH